MLVVTNFRIRANQSNYLSSLICSSLAAALLWISFNSLAHLSEIVSPFSLYKAHVLTPSTRPIPPPMIPAAVIFKFAILIVDHFI